MGGVEPSIAGSDDLKRDLQIRGDFFKISKSEVILVNKNYLLLFFLGNGNIKGFIGCLRKVKYEVSRNGRTRMKSLGTKWEKNNKVIPSLLLLLLLSLLYYYFTTR